MKNTSLSKFYSEALAIPELAESLHNISCDDGIKITDYTKYEILSEADYVLSTFFEGGHWNNEDLNSEVPELRNIALKQVNQLKYFIKKYR